LFIEISETYGEKTNDQFFLLLPETNTDKNSPATLGQDINKNMAWHTPIGSIPIGNRMPPQPPRWREKNIVAVPWPTHDLPRHSEKYITKFNPNDKDSVEKQLLRYTQWHYKHSKCNMRMSHEGFFHNPSREKIPHGFLILMSDQSRDGINLKRSSSPSME